MKIIRGGKYICPSCTILILIQPAAVGIASVVRSRGGIISAAGIIKHQPNILVGIDFNRIHTNRHKFTSSREGHIELRHGIGGGSFTVIVDRQCARHRLNVVGDDRGDKVAIVRASRNHDTPIERAARLANMILQSPVVIVVPSSIIVDRPRARRVGFGISPAEVDTRFVYGSRLFGSALEMVARLVEPQLCDAAHARGIAIRHSASVEFAIRQRSGGELHIVLVGGTGGNRVAIKIGECQQGFYIMTLSVGNIVPCSPSRARDIKIGWLFNSFHHLIR